MLIKQHIMLLFYDKLYNEIHTKILYLNILVYDYSYKPKHINEFKIITIINLISLNI